MTPQALIGAALAILFIAACDVSQKKPETGAILPSTETAARVSGSSPGASAAGERSIRLFGRGVSRQRQLRV
jgi:hypothetical protein